ncbi:hypothetical protein ML401_23220 [Bradyrhizobium sp. 62B]|uniref:hypothetical protein n=1 Tax=Bradyrhizobium sp. 62B TaxID=2898442 RepID=UPI0025582AEC|nr:hypothetical protein ML401_23220 [Bradyrhizobium sp. 62B]
MPQATYQGVLRFEDIEIEVAILEDGQRVITQSGFMVGLGRTRPPKGRPYYKSGTNLPAFLKVQNLEPFIVEDLVTAAHQIEFRTKSGAKAFGYTPEFLPEVCRAFARAQHAGVLKAAQHKIANRAKTIAEQLERSFTMRLIHEATNYQECREKQTQRNPCRYEE